MGFTKILLLLTVVATISSCGKGNAEKEAAAKRADSLAKADLNIKEIVGICNIEPIEHLISLQSQASGLVTAVFADANAQVKKGDILLEVDHSVESAAITQCSMKIASQNAAIAQNKASLDAVEVQRDQAKKNYLRDQALYQGKAITAKDFENSEASYLNLQKQCDAQSAALKLAQAKANELEADLALAKANLEKRFIKAPADGVLLSADIHPGENISAEQIFGDFAPGSGLMAVIEVDELFAGKVANGQKAIVRNQGSSETITTGEVFFTSPLLKKKSLFSDKASNLEDRRVREVRVKLQPNDQLIIGSRLECVIYLQ
jgi:multidrug efflux pump subunit AcrA (membrane-fusion protein)